MANFDELLLEEVRFVRSELGELRTENGREFSALTRQVGDLQSQVAVMERTVTDHCRDLGLHAPAQKRPCTLLSQHLSRHWAVLIGLLLALAGAAFSGGWALFQVLARVKP